MSILFWLTPTSCVREFYKWVADISGKCLEFREQKARFIWNVCNRVLKMALVTSIDITADLEFGNNYIKDIVFLLLRIKVWLKSRYLKGLFIKHLN